MGTEHLTAHIYVGHPFDVPGLGTTARPQVVFLTSAQYEPYYVDDRKYFERHARDSQGRQSGLPSLDPTDAIEVYREWRERNGDKRP